MKRHQLYLILLGFCFAGGATTARAAPEPSETTSSENPLLEQARTAFAEGRALMSERRFREAIDKFRLAAQVKDTPGLHYYIAFCLEQLDELIQAQSEYATAAELLKEFEAQDVRDLLPEAQARIERSLAVLEVEGAHADDQILVDGNKVDAMNPIRVNPGSHEIAHTSNRAGSTRKIRVRLARGQTKVVDLRSEPGELTSAPVEAPRTESSSAKPIVFWSSVALASVGAGAVTFGLIQRQNKANEGQTLAQEIALATNSNTSCGPNGPGHPFCDPLQRARADYDTATTIAIIGGVAAGTGILGALLTHFLWEDSPVATTAWATPESGGFVLSGYF